MDEPHICGRCGYDLGGIVESWGDERNTREGAACPLEGTCSECGWGFAWRDVFNAWRLDKPWLLEHARTRRAMLRRIPRTAWRVALPWKFWGRLSMQARVRPWVAAVAMLLVLMPMHLGVNGHETYRVIQNELGMVKNWGVRRGFTPAPLDRTAVRPIIESVVGAPVVRPKWTLTQMIPRLRRGSIVPQGAAAPVISTTLTQITMRSAIPWWAVSAGTMLAAWVGLLALLPATRALTKLRWAHVARSAVYCTAGVVVLIEVARLMTYHEPSGTYEMQGPVFGVIAVWVSVWWGCAVTLGWPMKHARAVAVLLGVASLLAGVTAGVMFDLSILMGLF